MIEYDSSGQETKRRIFLSLTDVLRAARHAFERDDARRVDILLCDENQFAMDAEYGKEVP